VTTALTETIRKNGRPIYSVVAVFTDFSESFRYVSIFVGNATAAIPPLSRPLSVGTESRINLKFPFSRGWICNLEFCSMGYGLDHPDSFGTVGPEQQGSQCNSKQKVRV